MESAEGTKTADAPSGHLLRRVSAVGAVSTVVGGSAFALLSAMASPASANTYTVTLNTDDGTGTVDGTLSKAIAQANANAGPDVIDFATGLTSITFSGSARQVPILNTVAIRGPGSAGLTIDLNSNCGLFANLASGESLSVSGLKIINGSSKNSTCGSSSKRGGGLLLYQYHATPSSVTINDVTFDHNYSALYGGAVMASGKLSVAITNSTFTYNESFYSGGALYLKLNAQDVSIANSTISRNTAAADGGGLKLNVNPGHSSTITNSVISGNTASDVGGGAYFNGSGNTTILNSTISGNTGGYAGGIGSNTALKVIQSTVTANTGSRRGGGIGVRQGLLQNQTIGAQIIMSTVSGNTATNGNGNEVYFTRPGGAASTWSSIVGSIVAGTGNSVFGVDIGSPGASPVTVSNSLIGASTAVTFTDGGGNTTGVANPKLDALADNGGPTKTMKLQAGSPALDAGPATVPTFPDNAFDQRGTGFDRVRGSKVDIGAFEDQSAPAPTTSSSSTSTSSSSTSSTTSTTAPSSSTTTTTSSSTSTSTTIDVSPNGPATPVGGELLELPAGDAAQIDANGIVMELPITQTGPQSIEFGLQTIGADLGGTKVTDGKRLDLTVGGNGSGDGYGFQAGSTASVWILSDPHQLGTATVKPDGTFDVPFVVPADLAAGGHTVQLQGIGYDGQPRALLAGVTVTADGSALPRTGSDISMPLAIGGGLLAAGAAGVFASRRTRPAVARAKD